MNAPVEPGPSSRRQDLRRLRALAMDALASYDLAAPAGAGAVEVRLIQHEENTTFLARAAGQRYVLRIHRPPLRTAQTVEGELRWLAALSEQTDLVVPQPMSTSAGALLVQAGAALGDPRICVLFRWVPGRFVSAGLRPEHLFQAGRLAARLQQHGRDWAAPADFRRPRQGLITEAARAAEAAGVSPAQARREPTAFDDHARALTELTEVLGRKAVAPVGELLDQVVAHRAELGTGADVYGLQHGDLHQENYLFQRGQIRIIDFDDCGFGWHIDDLAVAASEVQGRRNTGELVDALCDGYGRPVDRDALELHIAFRYLQIAVWMFSLRDRFPDWHTNVTELIEAVAERLG